MNNGLPEEDLGFFNEVSFPDIGEFGLGWDPQRVRRRKREAREFPYYYEQQRRPPAPRRQRQHGGQRQFSRPPPTSHSNRRKGPGGFWDDPDFDADFFSGGPPQPNNFDSYSNSKYQQQQQQPRPQPHSYYPQQQSQPQYPETPRAYRPRPQPKPQRPKIKPTRVSHCWLLRSVLTFFSQNIFQYVDRYSISENSFNSLEQDNSILGSGNFDILKGGTFYDKDDYLRPYRCLVLT